MANDEQHPDSKTEQIAEDIRDAIRAGQLTRGTLYSARELGERFGASRTPVREAGAGQASEVSAVEKGLSTMVGAVNEATGRPATLPLGAPTSVGSGSRRTMCSAAFATR